MMKRRVSRRVRGATTVSAVIVALLAGFVRGGPPPVQARADEPLQVLGELPGQPTDKAFTRAEMLAIDPPRRRLYMHYVDTNNANHLSEYDLTPQLPRVVRTALIPDFPSTSSRFLTALDSKRQLMYFVNAYSNPNPGTEIQIFDERSFKMGSKPWSLVTALPGYVATDIVYAPQDDRVYLVGREMVHGLAAAFFDLGFTPVAPPTIVVALDPATRSVVWTKFVRECVQPMSFFGIGGFVGRSTLRDALYFFCQSGSAPTGAVLYPGETGLIRLSIAPKATSTTEALNFPVEFFPISGSYTTNGGTAVAGMDHLSDRVFVQSLSSATPGAWVFDGNISAWVGLIAAPDEADSYLGIDESNGHYFMADSINASPKHLRYLLVSNARMTPPPQGDVYPIAADSDIAVDPLSHRLFVGVIVPGAIHDRIYVVKDNTPNPEQDQPVDYDDLTTDVAEGPSTISSYSAGVDGFGARAFLVGGVGGAESFAPTLQSAPPDVLTTIREVEPQALKDQGVPTPAIQRGDRGFYLARVGAVDLRNSGAAASSQALAPDSATDSEYGTYLKFLESTPAGAAASTLAWPYQPAACLDGGGSPSSPEKSGAKSKCDLEGNTSSAHTSMSALSMGPLTVALASFDTEATRDAKLGAVTTTKAVAKGIELSVPGLGTLSIGRVSAVAHTLAHGRPGSARVTYERFIQDVVVTDASGKETFSCAATCNPEDVAKAINTNLGAKVRMEIPPEDKRATERGAFAGVRKTFRDYVAGQAQNNDSSQALPAIELTINNDSAEKSRLHVQLAAIEASSIYDISLLSDFSGGDGGGGLPNITPPIDNIAPPPVVDNNGFNNNPQPGIVAPRSRNFLRGALLLARSPKDTAIVLLIFALIAGSVMAAYRRHSLVRHLEEEV